MNTIKLKFIKSLYPYSKGTVIDFPKHKYTNLIKKHSIVIEEEVQETEEVLEVQEEEEVEPKKAKKQVKKAKNKAILSNKNTK